VTARAKWIPLIWVLVDLWRLRTFLIAGAVFLYSDNVGVIRIKWP
jgi:hypothetical protein